MMPAAKTPSQYQSNRGSLGCVLHKVCNGLQCI